MSEIEPVYLNQRLLLLLLLMEEEEEEVGPRRRATSISSVCKGALCIANPLWCHGAEGGAELSALIRASCLEGQARAKPSRVELSQASRHGTGAMSTAAAAGPGPLRHWHAGKWVNVMSGSRWPEAGLVLGAGPRICSGRFPLMADRTPMEI